MCGWIKARTISIFTPMKGESDLYFTVEVFMQDLFWPKMKLVYAINIFLEIYIQLFPICLLL
jgi:hypothetical protein